MTFRNIVAALVLAPAAALAQTPPPQNVLQLAATGTVEVQQDLLTLSLTTTRDGPEPTAVQAQLKELEAICHHKGRGVAIGHPRDTTIEALEE